MSKEIDIWEIRARCECRSWMIRNMYKQMARRSGLDKAIDKATGKEDSWVDEAIVLFTDQIADLELLNEDSSREKEVLKQVKALKKQPKDEQAQ